MSSPRAGPSWPPPDTREPHRAPRPPLELPPPRPQRTGLSLPGWLLPSLSSWAELLFPRSPFRSCPHLSSNSAPTLPHGPNPGFPHRCPHTRPQKAAGQGPDTRRSEAQTRGPVRRASEASSVQRGGASKHQYSEGQQEAGQRTHLGGRTQETATHRARGGR